MLYLIVYVIIKFKSSPIRKSDVKGCLHLLIQNWCL